MNEVSEQHIRDAARRVEALELPAGAEVAPLWRQAASAALPSTVAVALLACIALIPQPTLAALLAGVEAGLGVAAVLSLGGADPRLYVDPRSSVYYRR